MNNNDWWLGFRKYSQALGKLNHIPEVITRNLHRTTRLFALLKEHRADAVSVVPEKIEGLIKSAEELLKEIETLKEHAHQQQSQKFYSAFSQIIAQGLRDLKASPLVAQQAITGMIPHKSTLAQTVQDFSQANQFGTQLYELKKKYIPIMAARYEGKAVQGAKHKTADEADQLEGFLDVSEHWLKHLYALDYSKRVLQENIDDKKSPVVKDPLPLQFRLERNKPAYTIRLIKASYQQPTSSDVTTLDIINACYEIPTFNREGKTLIDDPEVIRFIRLHSKKDDLMNFTSDPLSEIASQMYDILVRIIKEIQQSSKNTIALINRTPMQDMEYAFAGINPDECRTLLRLKFNTILPGLNEDHFRTSQKKTPREHSIRTQEATEEYKRNFKKMRDEQLSSLKSSLAMSYWLRKMLTSVIRNNQTLKKRATEDPTQPESKDPAALDFDKWMLVGTSQTIGEEDIANFYISPDDIIGTQMSIQRVDRTDKWIAVRKSEKMHRIRKQDFFFVVQSVIEQDLNPVLKNYNLRTVNLHRQLLPEIQERLGDERRIDLLRSGILGTIITNLDEFIEATEFHKTLRRYFKEPDYDNIHYPAHEKLRLLAGGLAYSNTSILQMKYRRVLRVMEEVKDALPRLDTAIQSASGISEKTELEERRKLTQKLQGIIRKVQEILLYAKPTLKDVRLEPD
ncbi:MAG: hypothetical protein HQ517_14005 [SAR324 cluster bacterium]|nr:hypothetical protein [SAR324 cluster bacterium]